MNKNHIKRSCNRRMDEYNIYFRLNLNACQSAVQDHAKIISVKLYPRMIPISYIEFSNITQLMVCPKWHIFIRLYFSDNLFLLNQLSSTLSELLRSFSISEDTAIAVSSTQRQLRPCAKGQASGCYLGGHHRSPIQGQI